jgi:hypothetical protein
MPRHFLRVSRAFLLSFPLVVGGLAVGYNPRPVSAQQAGEPVCWAEWCEGNVCVRVKIKCPAVVEPIT